MRPIALNRKNCLFAGHDDGAINWACLANAPAYELLGKKLP
jgi:transposase